MFPEEPVGAVMRERSRDRWESKGRVVLEYNERYFSTEPSQKRWRERERNKRMRDPEVHGFDEFGEKMVICKSTELFHSAFD